MSPTGLRAQKKARTRAAILDQAMALFAERGFAQSTTAQIARRCDLSEATLFNYFPSKLSILVAIIQSQILPPEMVLDEAAATVEAVEASLVGGIRAVLETSRAVDKALLSEAIGAAFTQSDLRSDILGTWQALDEALLHQLGAYLRDRVAAGVLPREARLETFATLGYQVVIGQHFNYVLDPDQSFDAFIGAVDTAVRSLFRAFVAAEH